MNNIQKVIKYLAIALAIFIIIQIFLLTSNIFLGISNLLAKEDESKDMKNIEIKENISKLDINVSTASILIKEGNTFKIETKSSYINSKISKNELRIEEQKNTWWKNKKNSQLTIYIPKEVNFKQVSIETGAGIMSIESLKTSDLTLEIGAGKVEIEYINVENTANINGGVGSFKIKDGLLHNLKLDVGIGKTDITAKITGKSDIDSGIGQLNLNLMGLKDDYQINVKKGLGNVVVDGNIVNKVLQYGNGDYYIDISGGVGNINVIFLSEQD